MPRSRKRLGLPGRRLDRVVNAGPRVAASAAVATPPQPQPQRVARADGPRFRYVQQYGPRNHDQMKVLATIAAFLDAGIGDPTIREIDRHAQLGLFPVVRIVNKLAEEKWIRVDWVRRDEQRRNARSNHYVITNKKEVAP